MFSLWAASNGVRALIAVLCAGRRARGLRDLKYVC
jgi:hypothetical protein